MTRAVLAIAAAGLLSGCAYQMTLMPRDSGKFFVGELTGAGGQGTMTMRMDGVTCTGPAARVASNQTFGFANTYGSNSRGLSANAFTTYSQSGDSYVKAILSCSDGKGLRCDLTGRGASGGGVCVDDAGKVYDALATRK